MRISYANSSTAASLNKASDELTEAVTVLDEAIKNLNIGLTVWHSFAWGYVEPPEYSADQIGYAKVNGKWGIALRHIWGNEAFDDDHSDGPWLFGEAPRQMRIRAADHFPKLIQTLVKESTETAKKLRAKATDVKNLVAVVEGITKEQVSK